MRAIIILIAILFVCTFIMSCKKDKDNAPGLSENGTIQYKVNGVQTTMDNKNISNGEFVDFRKLLKGSVIPKTSYALNAQKDANNLILFTINTDTLEAINYHYDSVYWWTPTAYFAFVINYSGQNASVRYDGDYLDVNISSHSNGLVTGTFTAKLTPAADYNRKNTIVITEGKLNKVPVSY